MKRFYHQATHVVHLIDSGRKIGCNQGRSCQEVVRVEAEDLPDGSIIEIWYDDWSLDEAELWDTFVVTKGRASKRGAPSVEELARALEAMHRFSWPAQPGALRLLYSDEWVADKAAEAPDDWFEWAPYGAQDMRDKYGRVTAAKALRRCAPGLTGYLIEAGADWLD